MSSRSPGDAPAVSVEVLIPHRDRAESLGRTLDSLRRQTVRPAVTVIDNGSTDATHAMLAERYPEVRCLRLGQNLGFGAAVNRGVGASDAELVVLLNNDAVADERFLAEVVAAQRASGAEMVAGCLRSLDGRVESFGVETDRSLISYDLGFGDAYDPDRPPPRLPLGPCGGAGAYLREAFLAVGGFDEAIFAYLEDTELALRMRLAGAHCALAPRAFVWHEHSGTLGSGASSKNRLMGSSRAYIAWRHGGALPRSARLRGHCVDAVVGIGQAVIDRNVGMLRGRLGRARELRRRPRPQPDPRVNQLPLLDRSLREALGVRLARRR